MAQKGLIFLEAKSAILYEQLHPRILSGKREPCEITFNDFDDVLFKIYCSQDTPNIVQVHIAMKSVEELKKNGSKDLLERLFPGMETAPADGFNYALQFDCDNLPGDATQFLTSVSELKRHIAGGPLDRAFDALQAKKVDSVPRLAVQYRKSETMYVVPGGGKVLVVFQVDFADVTDRALARVFLQEFVEAQRSVRSAPSVGFSKEPPAEIAGLPVAPRAETAGYISFSVDDRFVAANNKDKTITLLVGFRNYLHYHIKCSKTYLHMRMRKRVAGWMLVLNRALPEVEGEKKTAAGKTFARK